MIRLFGASETVRVVTTTAAPVSVLAVYSDYDGVSASQGKQRTSISSATTTTGSRWSINGPAFSRLAYCSQYSLTVTCHTLNNLVAYDMPAASSASSAATAGNFAYISGFITPSADGNVIARFASEIAGSAIVAKAGSLLKWTRTL